MNSKSEKRFLYKKWLLFGCCAANIIVTIIVAAVTLNEVNDLINTGWWTVWTLRGLKTKRTFTWIYSGVSIAIDLLGMACSWREHFPTSVVYLVLRGLMFFTTIWWSVWWIGRFWISVSLNSALIGFSISFVTELRRRRLYPTPIGALTPTFVNPAGQPVYYGPQSYAQPQQPPQLYAQPPQHYAQPPQQYAQPQQPPPQYAQPQQPPPQYAQPQQPPQPGFTQFEQPQQPEFNQYGQPAQPPQPGFTQYGHNPQTDTQKQ